MIERQNSFDLNVLPIVWPDTHAVVRRIRQWFEVGLRVRNAQITSPTRIAGVLLEIDAVHRHALPHGTECGLMTWVNNPLSNRAMSGGSGAGARTVG
ncbi:MAG TPA: hypothetical protein VK726_19060 [Acetobacteraceae bacterium]|nr:hypothetical protein [Acetobacteraceae bacterium]